MSSNDDLFNRLYYTDRRWENDTEGPRLNEPRAETQFSNESNVLYTLQIAEPYVVIGKKICLAMARRFVSKIFERRLVAAAMVL